MPCMCSIWTRLWWRGLGVSGLVARAVFERSKNVGRCVRQNMRGEGQISGRSNLLIPVTTPRHAPTAEAAAVETVGTDRPTELVSGSSSHPASLIAC